MNAHTHRPHDVTHHDFQPLRSNRTRCDVCGRTAGVETHRSRCISCGKAIQKVEAAPDRMAYWRTIR